MKNFLFLPIFFLSSAILFAQDLKSTQDQYSINVEFQEVSITEIISYLEENHNLRFFYEEEWFKGKLVNLSLNEASLDTALRQIFTSNLYDFTIIDEDYIVVYPNSQKLITIEEAKRAPVELSGKVTLTNLDTPVPNVTVFVLELNRGTVTNLDGEYSIALSPGTYTISFRSIDLHEEKYTLTLSDENKVLNAELFEKNRELQEIVITASELQENITSVDVGKVKLSKEFFRKLPTLLGEIDISRIVKSLPGVQSVGEGSADFYVRGGNRDQNLILMDDIRIYNSSHLLGFFSVYNPDMVNTLTLYKGSIPANYGGRLSSVLAVGLKNPSANKFDLEGGIGLISNRLSLNIPIADNHSLRLAGRYSNPTWLLQTIKDKDIRQSSASYYDFNIKYRYTLTSSSLLLFTAYYGYDKSYFASSHTGFDYSNLGSSIKYINNFSRRVSTEVHLTYTDYSASAIEDAVITSASSFTSGISNIVGYIDFNFEINRDFFIKTGIESTYTLYDLGETKPAAETSLISPNTLPLERSLESGIFIQSEFNATSKLRFGLGLRYSLFSNIGELNEYVFDKNRPKSENSILDTLVSAPGEIVRTFGGIEPRISATYRVKEDLSLKLSYSRTRQYQYLFSNSAASLPVDIWKPADNNIRPQIADQFAIGAVAKLSEDMYDLSTDLFYKNLPSTSLLKIGVPAIKNELLVADILEAQGYSYGLELLGKKTKGDLTGFLGYTYSVSKMKVNTEFASELINGGEYFRSDFDSPHNLSVAANYKVNKLLTFTANFVFNTGRPVTLPTASFISDNVRVFSVSERNNYRIPNTHRLDIAMTIEGSYRKNKRWHSSWTFSIYNVYSRENPFSVYVKAVNNTQPRLIKLSVFGNMIPSITYNFKFLPKAES